MNEQQKRIDRRGEGGGHGGEGKQGWEGKLEWRRVRRGEAQTGRR